MVSILQRMRKLKTLLAIRVGPGAAILPKEVAKLNLSFCQHIDGGHRGARKFWREMLPRLQYRNPGVPMTITRHLDPSLPATLTIFYRRPVATSTTTSPSSPVTPSGPRRVEKAIDIKNLSEAGILQLLLLETKATPCEPTEVELQELRELEEQKERSRRDSERSLEVRRQRKREEAMLKAARGEVLQAT
ncbi:uncharacterized protein K441DRAFT_708560 [Cenococcum geophilum 1.58]|uniref:uncharacterized protein n=1 Tax=Cenococcum geophilum 1.58 TaxID=794803 RepID=UPI00358E9C1A|nr:hypothetical protein K441DRAFT_708560 [Cenococcum geophilum 1.58]